MKRGNCNFKSMYALGGKSGKLAIATLLLAVLLLFCPSMGQAQVNSQYMTWDTGSGIWDASPSSTFWHGGGRTYFQSYDHVLFTDNALLGSYVITVDSNVVVAGMAVDGGNYTFNGTGKITGAVDGIIGSIVQPEGNLRISNQGNTVTINVEADFIYGTILSSGYLVVGNAKALGSFETNSSDISKSKGQLTMNGANAYVQFANSYTLNNRFVMSNGTMTIANGQTITVKDVDNTSTNNGGAFFMNYNANIVGTGNLVIADNKVLNNGGAIFGYNIILNTLSSLKVSGNTAGASGGGIYADGDTDIVLGKNVIFENNTATAGSGGAIYATDNLNVGGNTLFSGNTAGISGGAIYMAGDSAGALTLNTTGGHIVFTGNSANSLSNSVYLNKDTEVKILGTGGYNVYFNDPLTSGTAGGNSLTKDGSGFVQFNGANVLNAGGTGGVVNVNEGIFRVVKDASFFDNGTDGAFNLNSGATLAGGGSLKSSSFVLKGIVSPDSDTLAKPANIGGTGDHTANNKINEAKVIGTLTINGKTTLDGMQMDVNLGSAPAADMLVINGQVTYTANKNTINVLGSSFVAGSYKIIEITGGTGNNYEIDLGMFNKVTLDGGRFNPRYGTATLTHGAGAKENELWLTITQTSGKLRLEWAGDKVLSGSYGVWSDETKANLNWVTGEYRIDFQGKDYAYFGTQFIDEDDVTKNANQYVSVESNGVNTSGMQVAAGNYTFIGGDINGEIDGAAGTWNTGALLVSGAASATFYNTVDFKEGMTIENGASVTRAGTGKFADGMAIRNNGTLTFNTSAAYIQNGIISGTGTVIKNGVQALTLNGAHTGDSFTHNAGVLNLNGSWGGSYTQAAAGSLYVKDRTSSSIGGTALFSGIIDMQDTTVGNILNVGSTLTLNDAVIKINIGNDGQTSDNIKVTGALNTASSIKTVDIGEWNIGKYKILATDNLNSWSASGYNITINNTSLAKRQHATLKEEGNDVYLITSLANVQLTWASGSDEWNTDESPIRWNDTGAVTTANTYFADKDYVLFKQIDATPRTVSVQAAGVTVSGMEILGGTYIFTDGDITGTASGVTIAEGETWTATNKLDVKGGNATFRNTVTFGNGMAIANGATVTLDTDSNFSATNITNDGILHINAGSVLGTNTITNTRSVYFNTGDYTHGGTITGATGYVYKNTTGALTLGGIYTNAGTFSQSLGTVNLNKNWGGSYTQVGGTFNAANAVSVTGDYTQTGGILATGATATVGGKATLGGEVSFNGAAVGTLNVGSLELNGAILNITTATGNTNDKIVSGNGSGAITFGTNNNTIKLSLNGWTSGNIVIATGSLSAADVDSINNNGSYFNPVVITGGSARQSAEVKATTGSVYIVISGNNALNLYWNGTSTADTWNTEQINTNWVDSSNTAQYFANGDTVTFRNESGVKNVDVASGITANGINITGTDFVFSGGPLNAVIAAVASGASAEFGDIVVTVTNGLTNAGTLTLTDGANFNATKITNTQTGTLEFDNTGALGHSGIIAGEGNVIKNGTGALTLSGNYANAKSMHFTQNEGAVNLASDWGGIYMQNAGVFDSTGATRAIGGAATFKGTVNINGTGVGTLTVNNLVLNGANGVTLNITLGAGLTSDKIVSANGVLSATGTNTINWGASNDWAFTVGEYIIIEATGGVNSNNFALAYNPLLTGRQTMELVQVTGGTQLKLNAYLASGRMKWNGAVNGTIDGNWNYTTGNWTGIDTIFQENDFALFDNDGKIKTVAVQAGGVVTSGMEIASGTYTFTGGAISGNGTYKGQDAATNNTHKLDVKAGANATFGNTLTFSNGMNIANTATVTLANNSNVAATNITNAGTLNIGSGSTMGNTVTNTGNIFFTATDYTHTGTFTGAGSVTKNTAGTLTLNGTYTGATGTFNQSNGEVVLNYNWGGNYSQTGGTFTTGASNISVKDAALGGTSTTAGNVNLGGAGVGTLNVTSLTLSNAVLNITVSSATVNDKIIASGDVNFGDMSSITITGWDSSITEITIIEADGTLADINGKFNADITIVGGAERDKATIHKEGNTVVIRFTSGAALNLVWNGKDSANAWDNDQSNKNWLDSASAEQFFSNGDTVIFNNAAIVKTVVVDDAAGVTVGGITVENADYTFTGGAIGGSSAVAEIKTGASATFKNEALNIGKLIINTGASATLDNSDKFQASFGSTAITNKGELAFNITGESTHHGVITSDTHDGTDSSVIKTGTGTLVLGGTYTGYKGVLDHQNGTVELNKNWGGSYAQNANGTLTLTLTDTDNRTISGAATLAGTTKFANEKQTLTTGNLTLNGATLEIVVDATNKSSQLISTGNVAINGTNTVKISTWEPGTYHIVIADDAINRTDSVINDYFIADIAGGLTGRQTAVFGVTTANGKNVITLQLAEGKSFNLVWDGTDAAHAWNEVKSNTNWLNGSDPESFMDLDYVTFTNAAQNKDVEVVTGGVTVAGMLVNGGEYTFSNGSITGVKPVANGQTSTGKLEIVNSGTKATFEHSVDFVEGMTVGAGATAVLHNDGVSAKGKFADGMTIANSGTVEFDIATAGNSYTQTGALTGSGAVVKSGAGDLVLSGTGSTANGTFTHKTGGVTLNYGWGGDYSQTGGVLNTVANQAIAGNYTQSSGATLNAVNGTVLAKNATLAGELNIAGTGIGTLTVGTLGQGNSLTLNGATINITTGAGGTADRINVLGAVTVSGTNIVNAGAWAKGVYTILEAGSGVTSSILSNFNLNVTGLTNRKEAVLQVSGNALQIAMTSRNLSISWNGGSGNLDSANWKYSVADEKFVEGDAINFTTGTGAVSIGSDVTVAEMTVGGDYTFTGGKITGDNSVSEGLTGTTSKLVVSGTATFENEIDFKGGMDIVSGGKVTLHDNGTTANGNFGATAIDNKGTLEYNIDTVGNSYTQATAITGAGDVIKSGAGSLIMDIAGLGAFAHNAGNVTLNYGWGADYTQAAGILNANGNIDGNYIQNGGQLNAKDGITVDGNAELKGKTVIAGTSTGVVTITGGAKLDGATYSVSLSGASTSDQLKITGALTYGTGKTTINVDSWSTGKYEIIVAGSGLGNTNGFNTEVLYNGETLTGRKTASLSVENNKLILTTGGSNLYLTWTGNASSGDNWNTNDVWENTNVSSEIESFMDVDYVLFTDQYEGAVNIDSAVVVAGMEITGGTYEFGGEAISTGSNVSGSIVTATEKLKVSGAATDVTFNNEITFGKGADVLEGTVTVANKADFGTTGAGLNIAADGTVILDKADDQSAAAFVNTAITNAGTLAYVLGDGAAYEQNGNLTNSGIVEKSGAGTLTMSGTLNGTGAFMHKEGDVVMNTNWGGDYTQQNGALSVADAQKIGGDYAQQGGVLNAGNGMVIGGNATLAGTVNLNGANVGSMTTNTLTLDGATINITVDSKTSYDKIIVTGAANLGLNVNTVTINNWIDGTYTIIGSASVTGDANDAFTLNYNGNDRQIWRFENVAGNKGVNMILETMASMNLTWAGESNNRDWNYNPINKNWDNGNNVLIAFVEGDYATFTDDPLYVGTVNINQTGGVETSGVIIKGGEYTFTGEKLSGVTNSDFGSNSGKFVVEAPAKVTVENELDFVGGAVNEGELTFAYGDGAGSTAVANTGDLIFDIASGNTFDQQGVISGTGNVFKESAGTLQLTGQNTATGLFTQNDGTVELAYNWGGNYVQTGGTLTTTNTNVSVGSGNGLSEFNGILNPNGENDLGTLTIKGDAKFNNTEYIVTLGSNVSDKVVITGDVTFGSGNLSGITIGVWETGTYVIMTANSGLSNVNATTPIWVNGVDITQSTGRISATLDNTNDKQLVITTVASNMGLYWHNVNGNWNTVATNDNWHEVKHEITSDTQSFIAGDYAYFTKIGGGVISVQSGGVQTSGMIVEANSEYTFTGGEITGYDTASGNVTATGVLAVEDGAKVTFANENVYFNKGMDIADTASVILSNDGAAALGAFHKDMEIANRGTLEFNIDTVDNVYTQEGLIKGGGDVVKSGEGDLVMDFADVSGTGAFAHNAGNVTLNYGWGGDYTMATNAGSLTIVANATLSGDLTQHGGTFYAGKDMTIDGNYTQDVGAAIRTTGMAVTGDVVLKGDIYLNGNGNFIVNGNLDIDNATLHTDVTSANHVIKITGSMAGLNTNTVNIVTWAEGEYQIAIADSMQATICDIHTATLNNNPLASRKQVKFEVRDNKELWLIMASGASVELVWGGTATDNKWNTDENNKNWKDDVDPEYFVNKDTVIFDGSDSAPNVDVDSNGVNVSGMVVADGDYVFSGGDIKGDPAITGNNITGTGKLEVTGGSATFENNVEFSDGVEIASGGTVAVINGGGKSGDLNDMAIANEGDLIFDIRGPANQYGHDGVIDGSGNVIKRGDGSLALTAQNTADGNLRHELGEIELTYDWGGNYIQTTKDTVLTTAGADVTVGKTGGNSEFRGVLNPNGENAIGTLRIEGNVQFYDTTTYIVTLGPGNTSDKVYINDTTFDIAGLGSVDIGLWDIGEFEILYAGQNLTDPSGILVTINGETIANPRITAELSRKTGDDSIIILTTALSGGNTTLEWDKDNSNWNYSSQNWTNDTVIFVPGDYAKFLASGSDTVTVVPNGGVQVSGMSIEEGSEYVFTGNAITGTTVGSDAAEADGILTVNAANGSETTVVFENSVNFENGMVIADYATVTLANNGTDKLGKFGNMAITNNGDLVFDIETAGNVYTQTGVITGGNVVKNGAGTLIMQVAGSGAFTQNLGVVELRDGWAGNYNQTAGTLIGNTNITITGDLTLAGEVKPNGTMNVTGNLHLNGATLGINASTTKQDKINVDGNVTFAGTNHVTVYEWTDGEYVIIASATNGGIDAGAVGYFDQTTFNSGDRQTARLELRGDDLYLVLETTQNMDIIWGGKPGADGNVWDPNNNDKNWHDDNGIDSNFSHNDYVIFDETGTRKDIVVTDDGVTVGGMEINDGGYTFEGGAITGRPGVTGDGQLVINNGGSGSFNNELDFDGGIHIKDGGSLTVIGDKGSIDGNKVINEGQLNLNNGDSTIVSLEGNGGNVSFANGPGKLTITGDISGSQTFSPIYVDMNTGDITNQIVIGGNVNGHHRIELVGTGDINKPTTSPLPIIVIAENNTASGVIDANNFEYGIYTYGMRPNGDNTQWQLYRGGLSSIAQAIVNTAGSMSNSWFAQNDNLFKRMGDVRMGWRIKHSGNFWAKAYAVRLNADMDIAGVSKFRESIYGMDFGFDMFTYNTKTAQLTFGGFGGYSNTDRKFRDGSRSTGETDSIYAGFYGTWTNNDGWFVDGVVKGQYFNTDISARSDKADYDAYGLGMSLEVGRKITSGSSCNNFFIEPSLKVDYAYMMMDDYTTNRGLKVKGDNAHIFRLSGVVRAGADFELENGSILSPYVKAGFEAQASTGGKVRMAGERFKPNMDGVRAVFGAGMAWQVDEDIQMHVDYEGAFGKKYDKIFNVTVGVRVTF